MGEQPIKLNFSDENVSKLSNMADALGDTLIKVGFGDRVDYLSQIRLAAERHDPDTFRKYVVSSELFGGAGAMWEIWIEDKVLRDKFEKQFCEFVDLLKEIGIRNGRIDQVREGFKITPSGLRIILKGEIMVNLPVIVVLILCIFLFVELGFGPTLSVILATGIGWFAWGNLLEKWKQWALSKGVDRQRLYMLGKVGLINFYKYRILDDENVSKNSDKLSDD